jgi:N-acetylneuraminate synthase
MSPSIHIQGRAIGPGHPAYIIAELSANHGGDFDQAVRIVRAMKAAGADAVKLQTYTADTLTIACDNEWFRIAGGTLWDGRTLHELYQEAYMPWDWQPKLQAVAAELGMHFFSTPFDPTAVDFLESLHVPAHKVASFELVDIPLLRRIAATGKPVIASTGMATAAEIDEAVLALRQGGCTQLALLRCTSAYPAPPEEMHLRAIAALAARQNVPVGLSDHTLGIAVPVAAVALGACIIEKHFTLSRQQPGPDAAFSLEPDEFKAMVDAIRVAEKSLGSEHPEPGPAEARSRVFRRSLFAVADIAAGEAFTAENVRSIRPGHGLHPRHYQEVLRAHAARAIPRGTPLDWEMIQRG